MSGTETSLFWLAFLSVNEQATRDWLTGLYNRRYFEETLADHIESANRYGRELSLVLFDLDRFKQVNDTEGHDAGDRVLRVFAEKLKAAARSADIVCRFGGDEFAVILPETSETNARVFVERVLQNGAPAATAGIAALPSENLKADADAYLLAQKRGR
jgi:diguanylate cyclase (GGDEF)-like protein